jgi:hypothetical protein
VRFIKVVFCVIASIIVWSIYLFVAYVSLMTALL